MIVTMTEHEITAVRGALELARDNYRENATMLRTIPGHDRLAEQFDRQAADAEKLLDKIDD